MSPPVSLTHIGTATVLLDLGGYRILTDPALDPPGQTYSFGPGISSKKIAAPALPPGGLGHIDAMLLTHHQHADNFDAAGRAATDSVTTVVTTRSAAKHLGRGHGLADWERVELDTPHGKLAITATPARHGPPLSLPIVGPVIGFLLEWPGQQHGPLYISGDTVWFGGIEELARRHRVGTALLHVGGVKFGLSGPLRYTFSAGEAARAGRELGAHTIVPIHYDGWTHFREPRANVEKAFAEAGLTEKVKWLSPGEPTALVC